MSFIKKQGKTKQMFLPMTTSTAVTKATLCTFSSGLLVAATSGTAAADLIGVFVKTIASTDSDYATARLVAVEVPVERYTVWEGTTASMVATDIGVETDLTDAGTVNRGGTSVKAVRAVKLISATVGWFWIKFQGSY
jgi:hypothetical protein